MKNIIKNSIIAGAIAVGAMSSNVQAEEAFSERLVLGCTTYVSYHSSKWDVILEPDNTATQYFHKPFENATYQLITHNQTDYILITASDGLEIAINRFDGSAKFYNFDRSNPYHTEIWSLQIAGMESVCRVKPQKRIY